MRLACYVALFLGSACAMEADLEEAHEPLVNPPSGSYFVPADYDGDGFTDIAVKGSNGVWYIDVASCAVPSQLATKYREADCSNFVDDDVDGYINDGCPAIGAAENVADVHAYEPIYYTAADDDLDSYLNDGSPVAPRCLNADGFGGAWDFAYAGYGAGVPVPADYGTTGGGPADGIADLAIRTSDGMWAIDYADNGFGSFDAYFFGYGDPAATTAFPADYDGDGRADLAIRSNSSSGTWYFDYSKDGFTGWNLPCTVCPCTNPQVGYAPFNKPGTNVTAAVGDVDGDGCADISQKDSLGRWYFDLAKNGFVGWEAPCTGCTNPLQGYGDNTAKPIIANFDLGYIDPTPKQRADLAVVDANGFYAIDFAADGFTGWNTPFYPGSWAGGPATTQIAPGRFTSSWNGNIDYAVMATNGNVYIDRAHDGYGSVSVSPISSNRALLDPTRGHIDEMYISEPDLAACPYNLCSGNFTEFARTPETLSVGVRYTANVHLQPNTWCGDALDNDVDGWPNDGCPQFGSASEIACGDYIDDDHDNRVNDGCPASDIPEPETGALRANPALEIPAHLHVQNTGGEVIQNSAVPYTAAHYRRFMFTCTRPGSFPLGFMLSRIHEHAPVHRDYGQRVLCTSEAAGLYGRVSDRSANTPIAGATIKIDGVALPNPTDANGNWHAPTHTGGPHKIEVFKSGYATTEVINVRVPAVGTPAGIRVDTPLQIAGSLPVGVTYRTYIDYSRGRSILHVARVNVTQAPITLGRAPIIDIGTAQAPFWDFKTLYDTAIAQNAPVLVNGIWWTLAGLENTVTQPGTTTCYRADGPPDIKGTRAIGYLYINGFVAPTDATQTACTAGVCRPGDVECGESTWYADPVPGRPASTTGPSVLQERFTTPMFTVRGTGTARRVSIISTPTDFVTSTTGWARASAPNVPNCPAGNQCPIYDAQAPFGVSDYDYAMQMGNFFLKDGVLMSRGVTSAMGSIGFPGEHSFARTAVGVDATGTLAWFIVADGEGIDGAGGATARQLGEMFQYLGAHNAMLIDSGESTEMVVRNAGGHRRVNRLSSENHGADSGGSDYAPSGRVYAYIKLGN